MKNEEEGRKKERLLVSERYIHQTIPILGSAIQGFAGQMFGVISRGMIWD
jgi:hypothetical protein